MFDFEPCLQEFCDAGTLRDAISRKKCGLDPDDPEFIQLVLQFALDIAHGMK